MKFTSKHERQLLKIPYAKGKGSHTEQLTNLSALWNRTYGTVWQKWYSLHKAEGNMPGYPAKGVATSVAISAPVSVPAPTGNNKKTGIVPMTFTTVDFTGGRSKVMPLEEQSMRAGLDAAIKNELSNPKRGILFPTRLINRAKKYFTEKYPKNVFSFHSTGDKKDKTNSILVKRL